MRPGAVLGLCRPRVCLLAGLGAAAGHVLFLPVVDAELALAAGGSALLCAGASALNQVQERAEDAKMERTRLRPLPAGELGVRQALAAGLALCALAFAMLAAVGAAWFTPVVLLLYNGVYTPLKKKSSLAMLVGGLSGALPPVLGFVAAGGDALDPRALHLALVFYCWQVPHFWLFARLHRRDYEAAGFRVPNLGAAVGRPLLALSLWLLAYGACLLMAPAFRLVQGAPAQWLFVALAVLVAASARLIFRRERLGFALVNASLVLFLAGLALDAFRLMA